MVHQFVAKRTFKNDFAFEINDKVLYLTVEELFGMLHVVLVQRVAVADQDRKRISGATTSAARLLSLHFLSAFE